MDAENKPTAMMIIIIVLYDLAINQYEISVGDGWSTDLNISYCIYILFVIY